ncbi:MAG: acyl-CoA dehydrogenase family protein [Promethearchaeota archaeon]
MTEGEAGSNTADIRAIAEKDGHEYILNGSKKFITNAGFADYYFVWCITNQKVDPHQGISVFLVKKDTPGFNVETPYELLGLHGVVNGVLYFKNAQIPEENLICEEGNGFQILMSTFNVERITLSCECNGIFLVALETSKNYARKRI